MIYILLPLLKKLTEQPADCNFSALKLSIMMSTGFLKNPETVGEISNVLRTVNSYIRSPDEQSKLDVLKIMERIDQKTSS